MQSHLHRNVFNVLMDTFICSLSNNGFSYGFIIDLEIFANFVGNDPHID